MSRDTQFAGFARALVDDLRKAQWSDTTVQSEKIIAQRAYDLVKHCLDELHPSTVVSMLLGDMPDLTELPEVSE